MSDTHERAKDQGKNYNASSIQVLEGLEAVRKRPAMYIGDTMALGLHHLIWEVVDNSIDEALQGRCDRISLTIHKDLSISVLDNGAGIPVDIHPKFGVPALEIILTKLHAGGKFDKGSYQVSGGLHGVGVSVVNALSEWLEVEVYRDAKVYRQTFERGKKTSELAMLGETPNQGTMIRFKADPEIFEKTEVEWDRVEKRMRELAYLMGKMRLKITLSDERTGKEAEYLYPNGIIEFVKHLKSGKNALHEEVIFIVKESTSVDDYGVELALQYDDGYHENILTFVNNINTQEGGTHLIGFKSALTRALNQFARNNKLVKEKEKHPSGDDLREGLTAILSIEVPEPQFESQTKIRLGNREAETVVATVVGEGLKTFFEENPRVGRSIFEKAMEASRAREAARRAREQVRRKSAMESSSLPMKLADCNKDVPRSKAELMLVEGDSAGGTAISGRANFQAILPLRGKILNVEKAPAHKIMDHREIEAIVSAIGPTGFVGEEFIEEKLRYSKVIIMTDADIDGSHIRTLLLTFFYRKMPELVRRGYIYVAQPPLYCVKKGKQKFYVHSEKELREIKFKLGAGNTVLKIGDMNFEGARLEEVFGILSGIRDGCSFMRENDGFGVSDLVRYRDELGDWPTHRLIFRSNRVGPSRISGDGVKVAREETCIFLAGGEVEVDQIVKEMSREISDLQVSIKGDRAKHPDLEIQTLHLSNKFKAQVEKIRDIGIPLSIFDAKEDSGDMNAEAGDQADDQADELQIRVVVGKESKTVANLRLAIEEIYNSVSKDVITQRFKGLGEMNPDELWESTMDPERRVLLRVNLEDEANADQLFSILMGSVVEPRREFIEKHALEVTNLDV